jgi:hypothetical protein
MSALENDLNNSELSSGMYCRVKLLSTDVSEVRAASIIRDLNKFIEKCGYGKFNRRYNNVSHIHLQALLGVWRLSRRWSARALTANEVDLDCRKFEKH